MTDITAPITILATTISVDIATGMRGADGTDGQDGVGGGAVTRETSNTTIDTSAYQWNGNTDAGDFTYILPVGIQSRQYKIVNTGTSGNQLTITPNGTENLIGVNSSFILNDGESLVIGYDLTDGWY